MDAEERENARVFGKKLQGGINAIYTSPFPFCKETAASISSGAQANFRVEEIDWIDVSLFIEEFGEAMDTWNAYGHECVVKALYDDKPIPGFVEAPRKVANMLVSRLLDVANERDSGISILVSNGSVILYSLALVFHALPQPYEYPSALDGMLIYQKGSDVTAVYRSTRVTRQWRAGWPDRDR